MPIAIAVHGGAWAMPDELTAASAAGCCRGLQAGLAVLHCGGPSLDAVQAAVAVLEDDPVFDAGFGSFLNEDGFVECDAGMMDGRTMRTGSVAAASGVRNPVHLARRVLESPYAFIVGSGAHRFAERTGVPVCPPDELVSADELARWRASAGMTPEELIEQGLFGDTVGAVAADAHGNVAAATSTGGTPNKPSGRVGDSPIVGAGLFADNRFAAVSTTGHGELIIPLVMGTHSRWTCGAARTAAGRRLASGRTPHTLPRPRRAGHCGPGRAYRRRLQHTADGVRPLRREPGGGRRKPGRLIVSLAMRRETE